MGLRKQHFCYGLTPCSITRPSHLHAYRTWAKRGFSLIELVIVLTITAIAAMMAIPRYANSLTKYHAQASAQRLVDELAARQAQAQQTSQAVTLTFNISTNQCTVATTDSNTGITTNQIVDFGDDPYSTSIDSASFSGSTQITYDGYGSIDAGGSVVFQAGSYAKRVDIDAASGKGTIQ